jgi:hypothetical protein
LRDSPSDRAIVVDDQEPAGLPLGIERRDRGHRAFVQVPVQSRHGESLDRGLPQCVLEPAFEKLHLVVEEPVGSRLARTRSSDMASS